MQQLASQASKRAASAALNEDQRFSSAMSKQNGPLTPADLQAIQEGDLGLVCSREWKHGLMSRVPDNHFFRKVLSGNRTSLAIISAQIDSICGRIREIEHNLTRGLDADSLSDPDSSSSMSGPDSPCNHWPESCWPVPGMPFFRLADFGRRKYLVFAAVEEQLTNAKIHFIEAAKVARESNRILVLPKGGHSHLAVGRPMPMCAYCDLAHLNSTEWVSPEFFLLVARAAFSTLSLGFLCVDTPDLSRPCFGTKEIARSLGALLTLAMGHVPARGNIVKLHMPSRIDHVQTLLKAWADRDVVIYSKNTFDRFDKATDDIAQDVMPYAKQWRDVADSIVAGLPKSFIAVHFRSEFIAFNLAEERKTDLSSAERLKILGDRMEQCTRFAVRLINRMKKTHNATTVFIAADVPYNKSRATPRSESWGAMSWAFGNGTLTEVPQYWLAWLRKEVKGTVMIDELMPSLSSQDPGIVAIVDKLICAQSTIFLAGSGACGGRRNFEKDILLHRRNILGESTRIPRWANEQKVPWDKA
ncbi:hypothetical protein CLOM_g13145 [Closterium sp. NIES-68]|nr:hypothetical protein CLOM_g13145 [Closterium sp. NIES-68]GJP81104.1 hypothetical protein CLOP_g11286 [Closterium sp. NIES-67]